MKTKSAESMIALMHWKTNFRELKISIKLTFRISILARHNLSRQITITISRENSIILRTTLQLVLSWIKTIGLTQVTLRISIVTAKTLIQTSSSNRRIPDQILKEVSLLAQSIEAESAHLTITSNNKLLNHLPLLAPHSLGNNNNSMNLWKLKNNSNIPTWATPKLNHSIANPSEKASRDRTTMPWNNSNNKSNTRRFQHKTYDNLLKILLKSTQFWTVLIRPSRNWLNLKKLKMMLNNLVSWSIRYFSSNNSNRFSNSFHKLVKSITKTQQKIRRRNSEDVRKYQ